MLRNLIGLGTVVAVVSAALGVQAQTSEAAVSPVCNRYCDGRDPALASMDRLSASAALAGRRIELHFNDTDAMGWVSLQNGRPGDELWLDRSFDGGRTWSSGSRLGGTTVPSGVTGWRGAMVNVDNWAERGVGALRACGKAFDATAIACTAWARTTWNASDRRSAAVTGLMMNYNYGTGLFNTGWWNSANALTALIEHARTSGLTSYRYAIANTYDKQIGSALGQFRNDYIDDTGWWGLAWVAAYDLTGDSRYLNTARADADYMHTYWDSGCGGVFWRTSRTGKTAIANSLYLQINAALARRIPGDTVYRSRADASFTWFQASGLINSEGLVNDSVDNTNCRNAGTTIWTYNTGNLINAYTEYHRLTANAAALSAARRMADAMTSSARFNLNGVFREQCEPGCNGGADGPSFKGAAVRGLMQLNYGTNGAYGGWLRRQADAAHAATRNRLDMYGFHWAGPFDTADASRQHAAVDLLNAAA